jgi:hypothetical protein
MTDGLDMVAAGLMLFYGKEAEALIAHQVERVRQSGDESKAQRWGRIGARVRRLRQRQDVPVAV